MQAGERLKPVHRLFLNHCVALPLGREGFWSLHGPDRRASESSTGAVRVPEGFKRGSSAVPDSEPTRNRFGTDSEPISSRFRTDLEPTTDFEPIRNRFGTDFEPISNRLRTDAERIPEPISNRLGTPRFCTEKIGGGTGQRVIWKTLARDVRRVVLRFSPNSGPVFGF